MELIVSGVVMVAVVAMLLWERRGQSQREDRLIGGLKELAYGQREPMQLMSQHVRSLHTIVEQQADALVKIGELAPQKASLELRRMEYQFEVERTAAEAELARVKLARNVRETAPAEPSAAVPVSQSILE